VIFEPKLYYEQSHEHDAKQLEVYQQAAEQLCEDEGCPQFGTPHVCLSPSESAQADSLEAHSLKYQACAQIMQLSSGKFALFGAYRAGGGSGVELLAIGEWADLESYVREYKALADAAHARGQERMLPAKTAVDYDSLFGEEN
jgi:hypothetical protein